MESGSVQTGDTVEFFPSGKRNVIASIEEFHAPERLEAACDEAVGFTLQEQIYVRPGELMVKTGEPPPLVARRFKANIFWMGKRPLEKGKTYKIKLGSARATLRLVEVLETIDALSLQGTEKKQRVERHDVAECVFEAGQPLAFDRVSDIEPTGRFVIVDEYDIAGGGIIRGKMDEQAPDKGEQRFIAVLTGVGDEDLRDLTARFPQAQLHVIPG